MVGDRKLTVETIFCCQLLFFTAAAEIIRWIMFLPFGRLWASDKATLKLFVVSIPGVKCSIKLVSHMPRIRIPLLCAFSTAHFVYSTLMWILTILHRRSSDLNESNVKFWLTARCAAAHCEWIGFLRIIWPIREFRFYSNCCDGIPSRPTAQWNDVINCNSLA